MVIQYGFIYRIIGGILLTLYFQFKEDVKYQYPITIINHSELIDSHLKLFQKELGISYDSYRNHCYRVLTYTLHFLKQNITNLEIIQTSIVYHDLGLYNISLEHEEHMIAHSYLDKSNNLAYQHTKDVYNKDELLLQSKIISNHHKLWPIIISKEADDNNKIIEAIRKADWIDSSYGIFNKGMSRKNILEVMTSIPTYSYYSNVLIVLISYSHWYYNVQLGILYYMKSIINIFKW